MGNVLPCAISLDTEAIWIDLPIHDRFRDLSGSAFNGRSSDSIPDAVVESLQKNGVCLKGTLFTPVGRSTHTESLNVQLRKRLDLHVNLVHGFSIPGLITRHGDMDIVVIRYPLFFWGYLM